MNLYIDTSDFNQVTFAVSDGKKLVKRIYKIDSHKSHETLQKLDEFLKKFKFQSASWRANLKKIVVNKGPGSYTGTRVGVTIGQALGFAWNISVQFKNKEKFKIK